MSDLTPLDAEKIARVQGHLEGYADGIASQPFCFAPLVDRTDLIDALREDAATLASVLEC